MVYWHISKQSKNCKKFATWICNPFSLNKYDITCICQRKHHIKLSQNIPETTLTYEINSQSQTNIQCQSKQTLTMPHTKQEFNTTAQRYFRKFVNFFCFFFFFFFEFYFFFYK